MAEISLEDAVRCWKSYDNMLGEAYKNKHSEKANSIKELIAQIEAYLARLNPPNLDELKLVAKPYSAGFIANPSLAELDVVSQRMGEKAFLVDGIAAQIIAANADAKRPKRKPKEEVEIVSLDVKELTDLRNELAKLKSPQVGSIVIILSGDWAGKVAKVAGIGSQSETAICTRGKKHRQIPLTNIAVCAVSPQQFSELIAEEEKLEEAIANHEAHRLPTEDEAFQLLVKEIEKRSNLTLVGETPEEKLIRVAQNKEIFFERIAWGNEVLKSELMEEIKELKNQLEKMQADLERVEKF